MSCTCNCSDTVFRCFRALERCADRITGAAGPFFISLAVILLSVAMAAFFNVIQPSLPYSWLTTPICALIAVNILANYFYVCTTPPGFVDSKLNFGESGWLHAKPRKTKGVRWTEEYGLTKARIMQCRKCGSQRPERAHHCRICKTCVLRYDHHCPWVNQCVGLNNERYFVLFMVYLVLGSLCFSLLGLREIWNVFDLFAEWPHAIPPVAYVLSYVLAVVLCIAVGVTLIWHLLCIARGETTVESHDHDIYRKAAQSRGEIFTNSYDVGRRRNLVLFFNIGPTGYPWWTLLLPLKTNPYTDGWSWVRRPGLERHSGVKEGDEITDEEDT